MEINFVKYHGAGNDYIAIDGRVLEIDWGNLSIDMSKPHFGIFSDGIVVVFDSEIADIKMRIFNPDGSEAEMSGNGVRLFSKFVLDNKIFELGSKQTLTVETGGGVREVFPEFDSQGEMISAKVAMGQPKFNRDDIPVNPDLFDENIPIFDYEISIDEYNITIACVNIGNPHAVMITDKDVDSIDLLKIGPLVENNQMFPNRINFEIVNITSRNSIKARIFERGAGETLSSGTGTSACGIVCIKKGLVDEKVRVNVPGGFLDINWKIGEEAYLEGPTEKVFSGKWNIKEEN